MSGVGAISTLSNREVLEQALYCEVCGSEIVGKPGRSLVEGATLIVCQQCSSLGKELPGFPERRQRRPLLGSVTSHTRTPIESLPKAIEESDLVEDYPEIVKEGREARLVTDGSRIQGEGEGDGDPEDRVRQDTAHNAADEGTGTYTTGQTACPESRA